MTTDEIMKHIDHTLLRANAREEEIFALCEEALKLNTASVCIPPCYVKRVREKFGAEINICTVIGFPLGYSTSAVKAFETRGAVFDGADEIDMVINVTDVKNGRFDKVEEEIKAVRAECAGKILKVIIETCLLTDAEKTEMCRIVTAAGADYIKTSTGFAAAGADIADIELFKQHLGAGVKIKAAGGIRTREAAEAFIEAGCDRVGTSSAEAIGQTK